ncbi:MAG: DegT/DnrJ/EryC1/StrS aminotransferase family protein [Gammaproteobacteria bacterium]|nr:DegT/DnrJ/EryC1/StrS aminotransferase family protein [Gammaproteobacteria bacterium]
MTEISSTFFVANARTALKIAFQQLNMQPGQKVLIPDYICEVLIHPISQMNLIPIYYPVTKGLMPDWQVLESIVASSSCHALVMVHYFGQPQNIEQFRKFCSRYSLLLVEDNAHGYSGRFEGRRLGTFGDVGISSPRKFLGTPSGGVLHGEVFTSSEFVEALEPFPACRPRSILKMGANFCRPVRRLLRGWTDRNKDWSDPLLYQELVQPDYGIDRLSRWRIESANWQIIAMRRRGNWMAWAEFARSRGLMLIFDDVHHESCPWAMPVYAVSQAERNFWLEWGARNGISLFPWPSLPEHIVELNGDAISRWKRMVCFPLDMNPNELGL